MSRTLLAATATAAALAVAGCGSATSSSSSNPGGSPTQSSSPTGAPSTTPHQRAADFATSLVTRSRTPSGATPSERAPTKALDGLPMSPGLTSRPVVRARYWTVDKPAAAVLSWLESHAPAGLHVTRGSLGFTTGSTGSAGSTGRMVHVLTYQDAPLPAGIAVGDLYLAVTATGPSSAAIGAYAVTLPQQPRPAAERVPLTGVRAVLGWQIVVDGTPVRKTLTGPAAGRLARDFNALPVDVLGPHPCPMIPTRYGDVVVTFTAQGHTWRADIPACPSISVTRDGTALPALAFAQPFLDDVTSYVGHLPGGGPPQAPGGVRPLVQPNSGH